MGPARHTMPFGAEVLPGGGVRFRLWAPSAHAVDVVLENAPLAMTALEDGWFETVSPGARPGARYRYRIDGRTLVPDPASRFQPEDCEGPSEVIDPAAYAWKDDRWRGRPWKEAILYELHVGTFTAGGTYRAAMEKLPHLRDLGVTAIELMPLSDFAGRRNWGYDGVLPYASDSAYGRPDDLKALVQAAHDAGLMVFLDVVYNHFGPRGQYLWLYAPGFFTDRHHTPWGSAIDFTSYWVRQYFVQNVLYWLREYRFDGLRFDAVHAIIDDAPRHILDEIADEVHAAFDGERLVHLVLENDANQARYLGERKYAAQWNDDSHHGYHILATGERDGYYAAYADAPARHLARCLAEGFAYQGEVSPFSKEPRGEPSGHLTPDAFVDFMQNHDQIGNRAFGERLTVLAADEALMCLSAIMLLAPSPPLLFMGEEWGARQPFAFFCDFDGELGAAVREGRRKEFARFAVFADPAARERIPDPLAESTFRACVLRWDDAETPEGRRWLDHYSGLLRIRKEKIVPLAAQAGAYDMLGDRAFRVQWSLTGGGRLVLHANAGDTACRMPDPPERATEIHTHGRQGRAWSVGWWIAE